MMWLNTIANSHFSLVPFAKLVDNFMFDTDEFGDTSTA